MKTITPNQNCNGAGDKFGCMRFEQGSYGVIIFGLAGEQDSKSCSDHGVSWVITKVEATDTGSVDTGKGTAWNSSLPAWVSNSFYPLDDEDSGVLYDKILDDAQTSVALLNRNENIGAEDLWYRVSATNCRTKVTVISDPRIKNDGR